MPDYLNIHNIYAEDPNRRIDVPPGFDSVRPGSAEAEKTEETDAQAEQADAKAERDTPGAPLDGQAKPVEMCGGDLEEVAE
jgi:hypothetical protein